MYYFGLSFSHIQVRGISSALDGTKNLVHDGNADEESDMLSEDESESDEDISVLSD